MQPFGANWWCRCGALYLTRTARPSTGKAQTQRVRIRIVRRAYGRFGAIAAPARPLSADSKLSSSRPQRVRSIAVTWLPDERWATAKPAAICDAGMSKTSLSPDVVSAIFLRGARWVARHCNTAGRRTGGGQGRARSGTRGTTGLHDARGMIRESRASCDIKMRARGEQAVKAPGIRSARVAGNKT
jgi:hypothetical protein